MSALLAVRRIAVVLAAVLLSLTAVATTASAAPKADTTPCRQSGYLKYLDPTTGKPFVDQGTCVSFVSKGGTLQNHFTGTVDFSQVPWPQGVTPTACEVTSDIRGITGPTSVQWFVNGTATGQAVLIGTDGRYSTVIQEGDRLDVVVGGETFSTVGDCLPDTPPPAPTATIESFFFPFGGNQCTWNVRLTDYPANTQITVDLLFTNASGFPTTQQHVTTTDANGGSYFTAEFPLYGGTATASTTSPTASDTDTVYC